MPTSESVYSNYARFAMEAQVDLSAAGAVSATRGSNMTCTKTGTGAYSLVLKAGDNVKLVQVLKAKGSVMDPRASSTKHISIASVTQSATNGNITIAFVTAATLGGSAADETTAVLTVNLDVVIQTARMTNPLD